MYLENAFAHPYIHALIPPTHHTHIPHTPHAHTIQVIGSLIAFFIRYGLIKFLSEAQGLYEALHWIFFLALLTLGAHVQRGLLYLVCVSVCVCLSPLILSLQGPSRLISDTNGSSATRARKVMWRFCGVREYGVKTGDKATCLHRPQPIQAQWNIFYDGEARVLER